MSAAGLPTLGLRTAGSASDAAWRLVFRVGFRVQRQWWRWRRPSHRGALVAIWCGNRVLVVQQSYRPELCFPGGGVGRGEEPRLAACRELREELGLHVAPNALTLSLRMTAPWDYRSDNVHVFDLHLAEEPVITIDRREIVAARFMRPAAILRAETSPFVRARLEQGPGARPA